MEKDREFNEELLELFRNASIQADSSKKMFHSFLKLTSQRQSNGMDEENVDKNLLEYPLRKKLPAFEVDFLNESHFYMRCHKADTSDYIGEYGSILVNLIIQELRRIRGENSTSSDFKSDFRLGTNLWSYIQSRYNSSLQNIRNHRSEFKNKLFKYAYCLEYQRCNEVTNEECYCRPFLRVTRRVSR